ncbi:hypothetical protein [Streptomyces sp. NPDC004230]
MTEETISGTLPPVHSRPAAEPIGVECDPAPAELMHEGPVTRIELPEGEGRSWLVTGYDAVRAVANAPCSGRETVAGRQSARFPAHFVPRPGAVGLLDPPDRTRLRRSVAPAFTARGVDRLRERARELLGAFGFGPHCRPGGMPARPGAGLLVDALLDRMPGPRLTVSRARIPFGKGASIRGPEAPPVTW